MAEIINDNVGKKIVEALRMQNRHEEEFSDVKEETQPQKQINQEIEKTEAEMPSFDNDMESYDPILDDSMSENNITSSVNHSAQEEMEMMLQNSINNNMNNIQHSNVQVDFEYSNNVSILKHLISKLPAGVTKQTGAVIIRQTMEALGIPMKTVIQEAQQMQQALAARTRECQKNIIDCRKQIATLEIKVQQYQKQTVAMNDIINLFINTGV